MIAILIQSRLGSTRLPGKAVLPLGDATVLGQVIRRCKRSMADKVIVVTQDEPIADIASIEGTESSVSPSGERDVLAEMYLAASMSGADTIVRITGDCPAVSPKEIDQMIALYGESGRDIICNHSDAITGAGIDGLDIEVMSFEALEKAYKQATSGYDREHVCTWIYDNLKHSQPYFDWDFDEKLSIDTKEDYDKVFAIFENLGSEFETRDIMNYFKEKENE